MAKEDESVQRQEPRVHQCGDTLRGNCLRRELVPAVVCSLFPKGSCAGVVVPRVAIVRAIQPLRGGAKPEIGRFSGMGVGDMKVDILGTENSEAVDGGCEWIGLIHTIHRHEVVRG